MEHHRRGHQNQYKQNCGWQQMATTGAQRCMKTFHNAVDARACSDGAQHDACGWLYRPDLDVADVRPLKRPRSGGRSNSSFCIAAYRSCIAARMTSVPAQRDGMPMAVSRPGRKQGQSGSSHMPASPGLHAWHVHTVWSGGRSSG